MKSCAVCKGKTVRLYRDTDTLKIIVECAKCGQVLRTPYITVDSAQGAWNTKQAELEKEMKDKGADEN